MPRNLPDTALSWQRGRMWCVTACLLWGAFLLSLRNWCTYWSSWWVSRVAPWGFISTAGARCFLKCPLRRCGNNYHRSYVWSRGWIMINNLRRVFGLGRVTHHQKFKSVGSWGICWPPTLVVDAPCLLVSLSYLILLSVQRPFWYSGHPSGVGQEVKRGGGESGVFFGQENKSKLSVLPAAEFTLYQLWFHWQELMDLFDGGIVGFYQDLLEGRVQ